MGDKTEVGVVRTWGGAEEKRLILSTIAASDDLIWYPAPHLQLELDPSCQGQF